MPLICVLDSVFNLIRMIGFCAGITWLLIKGIVLFFSVLDQEAEKFAEVLCPVFARFLFLSFKSNSFMLKIGRMFEFGVA